MKTNMKALSTVVLGMVLSVSAVAQFDNSLAKTGKKLNFHLAQERPIKMQRNLRSIPGLWVTKSHIQVSVSVGHHLN